MHDVQYNTYDDLCIWIRYYLLKFSPKFLHPFWVQFFYYKKIKKRINLKNPKTFTDKLNYLKLYEVTKLKTILTDKLYAKSNIKRLNLPDLNYAKVYQICKSFDEIDFSKCPKSFIIKTNHACKTGRYIPDKNKLTKEDLKKYKKYFDKVLKINYAYWGTLELQYKNIKPLIFIEEFLESNKNNTTYKIKEYEVYCINGEPELIEYSCIFGENQKVTIRLDKDFKISKFDLFFHPPYADSKTGIEAVNKEKILKYARFLSSEFKFVRTDFFEIDDVLYFGEMTFTPHSGDLDIDPQEYDKILGDKLILD